MNGGERGGEEEEKMKEKKILQNEANEKLISEMRVCLTWTLLPHLNDLPPLQFPQSFWI